MRRVDIRRNSLSIIISGCNSSRGARRSAAISISTRSYHNNDANRTSWQQQQQQQRWSSCCWYKPTSIQSLQIPHVHHFSSLRNDNTTNKCEDDNKQEEIKLVSIHDHLDELHDIPLADVRNFCIIAHVVSKLVLRGVNINLHCPLTFFAIYMHFFICYLSYNDAPNLHMYKMNEWMNSI